MLSGAAEAVAARRATMLYFILIDGVFVFPMERQRVRDTGEQLAWKWNRERTMSTHRNLGWMEMWRY
jgi:hypothetical protein